MQGEYLEVSPDCYIPSPFMFTEHDRPLISLNLL
jgi:hypothetical protein